MMDALEHARMLGSSKSPAKEGEGFFGDCKDQRWFLVDEDIVCTILK